VDARVNEELNASMRHLSCRDAGAWSASRPGECRNPPLRLRETL